MHSLHSYRASRPLQGPHVQCEGFPCGSAGKEPTCNAGDPGSIPGLGRSPGEGKGYPLKYTGEFHGQSMGSQRVGQGWATFNFHILVTGKWQPTPVSLPGESHGRKSLVGYSPRGREESDTAERLHFTSMCSVNSAVTQSKSSEVANVWCGWRLQSWCLERVARFCVLLSATYGRNEFEYSTRLGAHQNWKRKQRRS